LTTNRTQPKDCRSPNHLGNITHAYRLASRPAALLLHGPCETFDCETFWLKTLMHFGVYLMIAALVLMGLEVGYALYQLAGMVL
jgi:hypothetical protein